MFESIEELFESYFGNEVQQKTGSEEDTEVKNTEEQPQISVEADEELTNLMSEQQVYDFAAKLHYYEARDKNDVFANFLTHYFFSEGFLVSEIALLGLDVAYSFLTKQPPQKIVDLFLAENAAMVGVGVAGKIVSYIQTRHKLNKSVQCLAKSKVLTEQINEKVAELAEEQGAFEQISQEESSKDKRYSELNPYIR